MNLELKGDEILPEVYDLSASIQYAITKHICTRVMRAMEFINRTELIPEPNRILVRARCIKVIQNILNFFYILQVVAGGVASNMFMRNNLNLLCNDMNFQLVVPPPKLCTDNGIMIAWNGVEKFRENLDIFSHNDLDKIDIQSK